MLGTLLSTLLLVNTAAAANPCAGVKVEADKFTQKTTAVVEGYESMPLYTKWAARFEDGVSELKVELPLGGLHNQALPGGYKLLLLMKNDSLVELVSPAEIPPSPQTIYGGVATVWHARFPVDKTVATALSEQKIVAIRAAFPTGDDVTIKVAGGSAGKLQKAFTCYASLLP